MNASVVVIGGGVAGLAAGAMLAKQGERVTVLERGNQPGGRAYAYNDRGFTLNYGPHAMYLPESGVLGDVLRRLGRPPLACGFPDPLRSYWSLGELWRDRREAAPVDDDEAAAAVQSRSPGASVLGATLRQT